jgi:hypothetical protein
VRVVPADVVAMSYGGNRRTFYGQGRGSGGGGGYGWGVGEEEVSEGVVASGAEEIRTKWNLEKGEEAISRSVESRRILMRKRLIMRFLQWMTRDLRSGIKLLLKLLILVRFRKIFVRRKVTDPPILVMLY